MSKAPVGGNLELTDHFGKAVTVRSFGGRYVLLFFGFTHCRVVCPTALALLTGALNRLGDAADKIQPLYVTVDPDRDTPEVMRQFLHEKYPRFLGLTGSATEIAAAKNDFKVFAQKKLDEAEPGGYSVPHTAFTFILDTKGDYLGHFANGATEGEIVERLHAIVESGKAVGAA